MSVQYLSIIRVSSICLHKSVSVFQAFTVVTVFNAMTFALKVTPFSVKSLSEATVAMERFKVRPVTSASALYC